jgi:hypothetical protein
VAESLFGRPVELDGPEAAQAAKRFVLGGRRHSLADCMIAATAIEAGAGLATTNPTDFVRFAENVALDDCRPGAKGRTIRSGRRLASRAIAGAGDRTDEREDCAR